MYSEYSEISFDQAMDRNDGSTNGPILIPSVDVINGTQDTSDTGRCSKHRCLARVELLGDFFINFSQILHNTFHCMWLSFALLVTFLRTPTIPSVPDLFRDPAPTHPCPPCISVLHLGRCPFLHKLHLEGVGGFR